MTRQDAEKEMFDGFIDGLNPDNPEPSENRSKSYRHGFSNARDDLRRNPRASAATLREIAEICIWEDCHD